MLGGTATTSFAWAHRTEARVSLAEEGIEQLGIRPDAYLYFMLEQRFGRAVVDLHADGAGPVEVMYRGLRRSGLSDEGVHEFMFVLGQARLKGAVQMMINRVDMW